MSGASVAIRLNPFKGCKGPEGAPVPWSPYGRILAERPSFTLDPLLHAGAYYVQDSSAMYVGHVFRKLLPAGLEHPVVLDLCAAPGGKTTDIAASLREACGGDFLMVANEVMRQRARALDDNVARWGDPCVAVTSVDPAAFAGMAGAFDVIVADVPCSGEGMFRKDERAREEWSPDVVRLCAARQKRILSDVWPALRDGGVLIYSTCTFEETENDDNLEWAASTLGGEIIAPELEFPELTSLTRQGVRLDIGLGEGQWVGALVKSGSGRRQDLARVKSALARLHPLRLDPPRGETKGRDFIPSPDWALSLDFERGAYPEAEVDLQTALHYLHRDAIQLPGAPLGYNVITFEGLPLGFVKNLGSRCNNLLPPGRRILMDVA